MSESDIKVKDDTKLEVQDETKLEVEEDNPVNTMAAFKSENSEEEDVPSDFFDDFSNQDFMAGLDIVDAWDEEELNDKDTAGTKPNMRRDNKRRRGNKHSPVRYVGTTKDDRSKGPTRKSKDAVNERRTPDHRRDPEKTKRDIQKDKDKCAKNDEARFISERLKVVETGLVPPGMEMEVDLKEIAPNLTLPIKNEREKVETNRENKGSGRIEQRPRRDVRKPLEKRRSRSTSASFIKRDRYIPKRRSTRSRDRSYERRVRERNRSSYKRSRTPRSPFRSKISSEHFTEERRRIRRYRDTSPTIIRRPSRERSNAFGSPNSVVSERELWLRQQHKREFSPSLGDMKRGDFLEELADKLKSEKKKKSILKEIQERLNEPSSVPRQNFNVGIVPGPVPPPMQSAHNHMPTQQPQMMPMSHSIPNFVPDYYPQPIADPTAQYDQQFFIGQPESFIPNLGFTPTQYPGPLGPPRIVSQPVPSPTTNLPHFTSNPQNNVDILKAQKVAEAQKVKDQEAVAKLFEDKKISLSDFLSVSAKHADHMKPVNVKKKVKVISQCQDAIKALQSDAKLGGRFFVKRTTSKEPDKRDEAKFQSALRKIPIVRFAFTTPSRSTEDKCNIHSSFGKLLTILGLGEIPSTPKLTPSPLSSDASVQSVPVIKPVVPVAASNKPLYRKYDPILGARFQMKMCQTDPFKCNICEIRKGRKFNDEGTQSTSATVDASTQITDDDLVRLGVRVPVKDVLKNQSFSHLTTAQILAAQSQASEEFEMPKKDIFPAGRVLASPSSMELSPEKQNIRATLSNNDSFPGRPDYHDRYQDYNMQPSRTGNFKLPSLFEKGQTNNRDNSAKRPNSSFEGNARMNSSFESPKQFENIRSNMGMQYNMNENRFRGEMEFNQSDDMDDFDAAPINNNFRGIRNKRRGGHFKSRPYGARQFY